MRTVVVRRSTPTSAALAAATPRWQPMTPEEALESLRPGDTALGRLDVLPTGDGIDDGLWALGALAARGVHVLNGAPALLATHDKLLTARLLRRSNVNHPRTFHTRVDRPDPVLAPPVVVKPRFGSGGVGVHLCEDERSLRAAMTWLTEQPWYESQGAIVQELVPPTGYDLRILVAGAQVVGSVFRVSAPGEWRTNVSLGGRREAVPEVPAAAQHVALAAARASGAALVGVDLMPTATGDWVVIELNGAVEFNREYRSDVDVYDAVGQALTRLEESARSREANALPDPLPPALLEES